MAGEAGRRRTAGGWLAWRRVRAVLLALPMLGIAWWTWQVFSFLTADDALGTTNEPVPCAEAPAFGGVAALPPDAGDAVCRVSAWQSTTYRVGFRTTSGALDAWLASAFPGAERAPYCAPGDADACVDLALPPGAAADTAQMDVHREGGRTVRVELWLFDV